MKKAKNQMDKENSMPDIWGEDVAYTDS